MRGLPTLFESDFIAFSCFKMAGCLSEEELEIAISLNGTSFVAVFSVSRYVARTILKHNFKFATKNELVYFAFRH
jgi:hypothetical protein